VRLVGAAGQLSQLEFQAPILAAPPLPLPLPQLFLH